MTRNRIAFGTICSLLAMSLVLYPVNAAGKKNQSKKKKPTPKKSDSKKSDTKDGPKKTEEPVLKTRTIGSIIFPERRGVIRQSSAKDLLTPDVRAVTERAMDFVRKSQQSDGSWGDKDFPKSSGVTALCCMALMAEGTLPRVGASGKKLDKGIEFLLSTAGEEGLMVSNDTYKYGPLYDHTWAIYAVMQAYGNIPWHKDARKKISRGIQKILQAQKTDGGWRYSISPLGTGDVSVTASVLTALRFARISGFAVPEKSIKRGQDFVLRCGKPRREEDNGTFCYREGGQRGGASTTAAGLLALFSRGLYNHEYIAPCTDNIAYVYSRYRIADLEKLRYFYFGCYYSSQAMYQAHDEFWKPWFKKYVSVLRATQGKNGEFRDRRGNTVYPTAIAAVILQAPYGYLPQFLR